MFYVSAGMSWRFEVSLCDFFLLKMKLNVPSVCMTTTVMIKLNKLYLIVSLLLTQAYAGRKQLSIRFSNAARMISMKSMQYVSNVLFYYCLFCVAQTFPSLSLVALTASTRHVVRRTSSLDRFNFVVIISLLNLTIRLFLNKK